MILYLIYFSFAYPVYFYNCDADKTAERYIYPTMFSIFIKLHMGIFRIWSQEKWHQKVFSVSLCYPFFFFCQKFTSMGIHYSSHEKIVPLFFCWFALIFILKCAQVPKVPKAFILLIWNLLLTSCTY